MKKYDKFPGQNAYAIFEPKGGGREDAVTYMRPLNEGSGTSTGDRGWNHSPGAPGSW